MDCRSVTTFVENLIRVWVQKHQAGVFDDEVERANLLQQYEARIAALSVFVE